MSGFGSMSSMNTSLKNNKKVRGVKKTMADRKGENAGKFKKESEPLEFKNNMSAEDRVVFLAKIKKDKIKMALTYLAVTVVVIVFFTWLFFF